MSASDEKSAPLYLTTMARPRTHPVTLRFPDEQVEQAYQRFYTSSVIGITRFGMLLAIVLYLLFAITDLWFMPERVALFWTVRAVMVAALMLVFAATWMPWFAQHQQKIMLVLVLVVGINIAVLLALRSGPSEYHYFIGMFLLMIGSHAVLGLQFPHALIACSLIVVFYGVVDFVIKDYALTTTYPNFLLFFGAFLITVTGARTSDRQRRLAYYSQLLVEHEREESRHNALHDVLTGLPNRRLLMEKLAHAVARDERYKTFAAVLFMDLDDFKEINDTYGHTFGDLLLKEVGRRLLACVRSTDTVARFGGDEFVVLLEDLRSTAEVRRSIKRINKCFDAPLEHQGIVVEVRMSIGQALHPKNGGEPRALLEFADRQMYLAKRQRKGHLG